MKVLGYLRVSTKEQDVAQQRLTILEYANKNSIKNVKFQEIQISSRRSTKDRRINQIFAEIGKGDQLIVSELSRLGRSLGEVVRIVDELVKCGIKCVAVKENIQVNGTPDMQTKMMVTMFGLFAEIERDLISERTKAGLAAAKAKGIQLGRRKGSLGKSKLDGKEQEIKEFLEKKVSKASIGKILGVSRSNICHFINTRQLQ